MKKLELWSKYYRVNTLTNEVAEQTIDSGPFDKDMMFHFINGANTPSPKYPVPKTFIFAKKADTFVEVEE